ncbi:hypothetical protein CEXT_626241 [Caerostris extrusa]|uniref:Uncharacterized protein n=1 Tax=Caerostris extrusa TaxID=172846 RepID=A0AAV4U7X2_CAEEX|nr:hypothetical protein CEXT_626241 [Caerostris extrusa]
MPLFRTIEVRTSRRSFKAQFTYCSPCALNERFRELENLSELLAHDAGHDRQEAVAYGADDQVLVKDDAEGEYFEEEERLDGHHVLVDPLHVLSPVQLESPVIERQLHHHVQGVEDGLFFQDLDYHVRLVEVSANFL